MIGRLNHVAIAVGDIAKASKLYRDTLGAEVSGVVPQPDHGVNTVFITLPNTKIELLEPLGENSPIAKFLERNPDGGIHHICYEVDDILKALTDPPQSKPKDQVLEPAPRTSPLATNYLEREARNRQLGLAGEEFVINFERARLISINRELLASRIQHVSKLRGDGDGFDVLSFEDSGAERLIEVKTTKYGRETPFFLSRNELSVSQFRSTQYLLYRVFGFRDRPQLFTLKGALSTTCIT